MTALTQALPAATAMLGQTTPTGAPVPAENGGAFLALLVAALPVPEPVTEPVAEPAGQPVVEPTAGEIPGEVPGAVPEEAVDQVVEEVPPEGDQVGQVPAQLVAQLAAQLSGRFALLLPAAGGSVAGPGPVTEAVTEAATEAVTDAAGAGPLAAAREPGSALPALPAPTDSADPLPTSLVPTSLPQAAAPADPNGTAGRDRSGDQATPGVDLTGMTPVTTAVPTPGPAATGTQPTAAAAAVAGQVFTEVTQLVSRGDGTHRITLTLSPEALGDVRVILTVRNGEVHVSFAAGDQARQALVESTPELVRLLELVGATETKVAVRDLGPQTAPGTDPRFGAGPGTSDGRREPQTHHARTREGQNATDGTTRGTRAHALPHEPATRTRSAGLDVTV
ncbi:flagellar hook-length control protein FliK [Nocardioides houyundeii]|uniref:flagellar hook-length control protein FliK n=1 Tax=Nocardioides houyundeii TaxID=2045452 RepID=UPI000DF4AD11|nr:flagellar hook-length control protein FliK [Nocardioides houyundeii]